MSLPGSLAGIVVVVDFLGVACDEAKRRIKGKEYARVFFACLVGAEEVVRGHEAASRRYLYRKRQQPVVGREYIETVVGIEDVAEYLFVGMAFDVLYLEPGLDVSAVGSAFCHHQVEEAAVAVGDEVAAVPAFDNRGYAVDVAGGRFKASCLHGLGKACALLGEYLARRAVDKLDAPLADAEDVVGERDPYPFGGRLEERGKPVAERAVGHEHAAFHVFQHVGREGDTVERVGHEAHEFQFTAVVEGQQLHVFGLGEKITPGVVVKHGGFLGGGVDAFAGNDEVVRHFAEIYHGFQRTFLDRALVERRQIERQGEDGDEYQEETYNLCHNQSSPLLKRCDV